MSFRKIIENLWIKIEIKYHQKRFRVAAYYKNCLMIFNLIRDKLVKLIDKVYILFLNIMSIAMPTKYIKKTKVVIIFSLLLFSLSIFLITPMVINKFIVINLYTILVLICFVGSILLLKRRYLGVWMIIFWGAIQIIPILYKDHYYDTNFTLFHALNTQGLVIGEIWSQVESRTGFETITSNLGCYVDYGPITLGMGINFTGIIVILLCIIILIQNDYFNSIKKYVLLTIVIFLTLMVPLGIYYYYNEKVNKIYEMVNILDSFRKDGTYEMEANDVIKKAIAAVQMDNDKIINKIFFRNINGKDMEWVFGDFIICRNFTKNVWHQGKFVGQTSEYIYGINKR